jgi:uncharacterized protein (TIGR02271 family)
MMDLRSALRPGLHVVGPDEHDYGEIERYDDEAVYVGGRPVPFGALERLDAERVYVGPAGVRYLAESPPMDEGLGFDNTSNQVRVPVYEEQLAVEPRVVDLGEIRVHKTVDEREEVRRGPLSREDVQIERIKVNRPVSEPEQRRQEGDWLVIPIMEEVFVVQKQLVVTEEIRIRKQLVTEEHEVRETLRREHASIEDARTARPPAAPAPARSETGRDDDDAAWDALQEEIRRADV